MDLVIEHVTDAKSPQTLGQLKKAVVKDLFKKHKVNENKKSLGSLFDGMKVSRDANGNILLTL